MITPIKSFFSSCLLLLVTTLTHAQVGIGTSSVDPSARLQVDAANKGFLPPRVVLQGTNDAQLTNPSSPRITSPATGLLVYNTATAGSGATAVTPGFYYYDGAKWQRIINQQPDATISFNQNTPTTGGVVFTPNIQNSTDYIYVSSTNSSQWTYNGSAYVTYTPPPSTPWMLSSGTSDAGSNKTGGIYRSGSVAIGGATTPNATLDLRTSPTSTTDPGAGYLGVGTTSSAASTAAAGAIRYSTGSGGVLEYSNGLTWNTLTSSVQKATVVAKKKTNQSFATLQSTNVIDWDEVVDVTSNFDPSTGIFTAPRLGNYIVSFSYVFTPALNAVNTQAEAILVTSGTANDKKAVTPFNSSGTSSAGASISFTIRLGALETVRPVVWHNLGSTRDLRIGTGTEDGFVNFSVTEL